MEPQVAGVILAGGADFAIEGVLDPFFNVNTPEDLEKAPRLAENEG